jgi:dUTP pyrophosphatase
MEEKNKIEELNKSLESIDNLFSNDFSSTEDEEEIDINSIMSNLGFSFEDLEKGFDEYEPTMPLRFSKSNEDAVTPEYAYPTDSGFDLYSTEEIVIESFGRALVPTGLHFDIPDGYEIQVRSKSGLALKQGLMVLNSPGTVDQGYTGEVKVILFNTSKSKITITKGQKVAQAVVSPVVSGKWIEVIEVNNVLDKTKDLVQQGYDYNSLFNT